jgi:hypothetical protein
MPVAEELVDTAAERGDVVDEPLERRVDEQLHLLGIQLLGEPVNPTRSANRTVTIRRASPCADEIACPHDGQNRASAGTEEPQDGHVTAASSPVPQPASSPIERRGILLRSDDRDGPHR